MRVDEQCKVLCRIDALSAAQAKAFKSKIEDDYRVNMYVSCSATRGGRILTAAPARSGVLLFLYPFCAAGPGGGARKTHPLLLTLLPTLLLLLLFLLLLVRARATCSPARRILDNLPVGMVKMRKEERSGGLVKTYERGYPVGFKAEMQGQSDSKYFLHNHLRYTILFHKDAATDLARIVGASPPPPSLPPRARLGAFRQTNSAALHTRTAAAVCRRKLARFARNGSSTGRDASADTRLLCLLRQCAADRRRRHPPRRALVAPPLQALRWSLSR